jgi:hypothetical protein
MIMASLFQFSIRSLLVGVTIAAVGLAALLNAGPWWEAAVWGGTLFVLAIAILLIVYRRQEGRAFWLGFAVLGWLYLGVVVYSWTPHAASGYPRRDPLAGQSLVTTQLAKLAYDSLLPKTKTQENIAAESQTVALDLGIPVAGEAMSRDRTTAARSRMDMIAAMMGASTTPMVPNPAYVPLNNFLHIAHALWLLLVAAIGGKSCQLIYRTRPREEQ